MGVMVLISLKEEKPFGMSREICLVLDSLCLPVMCG